MSITSHNNFSKNVIGVLALLIVMYVARNAFPFMIYPLSVCIGLMTLYALCTQRAIKQPFMDSVHIMYPLLILILIEIIAFLVTLPNFGRFQTNFLKEIVFAILFIYLFVTYIKNKEDLHQLFRYLFLFFFSFSVIISVLGILKFFYSPAFISKYQFYGQEMTIYGSSLVRDYNFFSLFLFNGLVLGTFYLLRNDKIRHPGWFIFALVVIMSATMLAGSRRLDMSALILVLMLFMLIVAPKLYAKFFNPAQRKTLVVYFLCIALDWALIFTMFMVYPRLESHPVATALGFKTEELNQSVHFVGHRFNSMVGSNIIATTPKAGKGFEDLTETRRSKWGEAADIYLYEYSPLYKITGKGFRYLQDFQNTNREYNHPHFQLLSILLYSGIIGCLIYIAFIVYIFVLYFKYLKPLSDYFFLFVINLLFGIFSFTDAIGATFFIFTLMIPLAYHYFTKKELQVQPAKL